MVSEVVLLGLGSVFCTNGRVQSNMLTFSNLSLIQAEFQLVENRLKEKPRLDETSVSVCQCPSHFQVIIRWLFVVQFIVQLNFFCVPFKFWGEPAEPLQTSTFFKIGPRRWGRSPLWGLQRFQDGLLYCIFCWYQHFRKMLCIKILTPILNF